MACACRALQSSPPSSPNASFTCTRAPTARDVYAYFAYFDWRKQSFEKYINLFCAEKQHNFAIAFEERVC